MTGVSTGYWTGVHAYPGANAWILDCDVSGASGPGNTGIWLEGSADIAGSTVTNISKTSGGTGIFIDSDSLDVVNLHESYNNILDITRYTEVHNAFRGLDVQGWSRPKIRKSIISDNQAYCVRIGFTAMPDLGTSPADPGNNSIHTVVNSTGKLAGGQVHLGDFGPVKAEGNWWGDATPPASKISTWVDYSPYLTNNPYGPSSFSNESLVHMQALPGVSSLKQGFPSPFSRDVSVPYSVGRVDEPVMIAVYDLSGRRVRLLVEEKMSQGEHQVRWDGREENGEIAPNGVYFLKARIGDVHASQRVVFIH